MLVVLGKLPLVQSRMSAPIQFTIEPFLPSLRPTRGSSSQDRIDHSSRRRISFPTPSGFLARRFSVRATSRCGPTLAFFLLSGSHLNFCRSLIDILVKDKHSVADKRNDR